MAGKKGGSKSGAKSGKSGKGGKGSSGGMMMPGMPPKGMGKGMKKGK